MMPEDDQRGFFLVRRLLVRFGVPALATGVGFTSSPTARR
jgi:hypothetical protein